MQQSEHYFGLLMSLDSVLHQAENILDAHDACPGCPLCRDAHGVEYLVDILFDLIFSDAPEEMHLRILGRCQSSKFRQSATDN